MPVRRSKFKILALCAIGITLFALYQRLKNSKHETLNSSKTRHDDKQNNKDNKLQLPPNIVERIPEDEDTETNGNSMPYYGTVEEMKQYALSQNFVQDFYNTEKFGEHTKDAIIIVVQVHDRTDFFEELLNSLRNVQDVNKATLVISFDKLTERNDKAIKKIDFCRYITIFFPYAMQLYPNSFPGQDPNDCERDWSKTEALQRKCINAEYPDMYGHYREVKYVQIKHHWLWKLHMVFSGIRAFAANTAPVLLLEEDYYVTPDILICLNAAMRLKEERCSKCQTISLGNFNPPNYESEGNQVEIKSWTSSAHNMGMVVTRSFYNQISGCTEEMCDYDDYNWDWSLQAAAGTSIAEGLHVMVFKAARVFHIGMCGTHFNTNCNAQDAAKAAASKFENANLYPASLHIALDSAAVAPAPKPNGGWGDLRDRTLCKQYKSLCSASMGL